MSSNCLTAHDVRLRAAVVGVTVQRDHPRCRLTVRGETTRWNSLAHDEATRQLFKASARTTCSPIVVGERAHRCICASSCRPSTESSLLASRRVPGRSRGVAWRCRLLLMEEDQTRRGSQAATQPPRQRDHEAHRNERSGDVIDLPWTARRGRHAVLRLELTNSRAMAFDRCSTVVFCCYTSSPIPPRWFL